MLDAERGVPGEIPRAVEPQRLLRMADSDQLLYAQPPEVDPQGANVQLRFDVPENAARLLLQRLAKMPPTPTVATN